MVPDKILNGYVGDGYITEAEKIFGYTLMTRPDNATGFLSLSHKMSGFANTQKNAALPQTGTNRHFSLIMLAMRSLTLIGAFVAAWFSRKK